MIICTFLNLKKVTYLDFVTNFQVDESRLAYHRIFVIGFMILIIEWGNFITI